MQRSWVCGPGVATGFTSSSSYRPGTDFSVFWVASHVMLHGVPAQVYDYVAFGKLEQLLLGGYQHGGFLPWLYPPMFLLLVTPLGAVAVLAWRSLLS